MIPVHYPLRPSDCASVPAVFGVLGITSCRINPEGNQRPPWSRLTSVRGSFSPVFQPRGGGVSPPNSLPLGYKFLYCLRPGCLGRLCPSVHPIRSSTRPGSPPEAVAVSATTRTALSQTNAAPHRFALITRTRRSTRPQEGRSSPERGLPREVSNEG